MHARWRWVARLILALLMLGGAIGVHAERRSPNLATTGERVLVLFEDAPTDDDVSALQASGATVRYWYRRIPCLAVTVRSDAIGGLRARPRVVAVEPDVRVHLLDAELDRSWGVKDIGAGTVHAAGNRGQGVKVAILDTGIDYTHPDLDGNYGGGYDFANGDSDPRDDHGHGTHCAGIVAAEDNGSGAVGVAPEATIYALKVLDAEGAGWFSDIVAAVEWCMDHDIDVTSNSYGIDGDPGTSVRQAFDQAYAAGIVHACAAGNEGSASGGGDSVSYPAKYSSCIAVAAVDKSHVRADFSSTGPDLELSAAGVAVYSTLPGNDYDSWNGTSMAAPHVAGVAALLKKSGVADPNTIRQRMVDTAVDLGAAGHDTRYGHGLVDAAAAVGGSGADDPPTVDITSHDEGDTVAGTVTVEAAAADDVGVTKVVFEVGPQRIGADKDGSDGWSIAWDTHMVKDGQRHLKATAHDTAGQTTTDKVIVQVDNGGGTPDPPGDDPPTVDITSHDESDTVAGTVTVEAAAADDVGVTKVVFEVGPQRIGADKDGSDGWSIAWDTHMVKDGQRHLKATAHDTAGQTTTDKVIVQVDNASGSSSAVHVGDLDGFVEWYTPYSWRARVKVKVHDQDHRPVVGAAVAGAWSGAVYGHAAGTTNSRGIAVLKSAPTWSWWPISLNITDVAAAGASYAPDDNHDPDWDSDGTTIVVYVY